MRKPHAGAARRRRRLALAAAALAPLVAFSTGCKGILDVQLPGNVTESQLNNPALAATLTASAVADFECAYDNFVMGTAVFSDEFRHSSGNLTMRLWDQRNVTPTMANYVSGSCAAAGFGLFTTIQTARFQAEDMAKRIDGFSDADVPDKMKDLATLDAYAGYSYVLMGETFCETTIDGGPVIKPPQILADAEDHFTKAIQEAQQAGAQDILNMAYVGRARTRLDLGDKSGALADAQQVPEGFIIYATRGADADRRWNKVWEYNQYNRNDSVDPAYRNLTFDGVPDPRVPVHDANTLGFDGTSELWVQDKYTDKTSPIPIAKWAEAQLIIAEVQGGQTAVDIINKLHDDAGLPHFAGGTEAQIQAQIIQERQRELFLEGHRMGDMLRYGIPFDTSPRFDNTPWGTATCFPLPTIEAVGNPNVNG